MSTHFQVAPYTGTQGCSLGCEQPAVRSITATFTFPITEKLRAGKTLSIYLCAACDLELRQELNRS